MSCHLVPEELCKEITVAADTVDADDRKMNYINVRYNAPEGQSTLIMSV